MKYNITHITPSGAVQVDYIECDKCIVKENSIIFTTDNIIVKVHPSANTYVNLEKHLESSDEVNEKYKEGLRLRTERLEKLKERKKELESLDISSGKIEGNIEGNLKYMSNKTFEIYKVILIGGLICLLTVSLVFLIKF